MKLAAHLGVVLERQKKHQPGSPDAMGKFSAPGAFEFSNSPAKRIKERRFAAILLDDGQPPGGARLPN
jgi:hypothetical protein